MPTTVTMPQLGESVTEGTVAQWLKKIGEHVEKYEAFVEVSTDKVNAEVPSPVTGIIRALIVAEGQTVSTGSPIAVIDEAGAVAVAVAAPNAVATNGVREHVESNGVDDGAARLSPAVRRLSREHGIDIANVRGTGARGRVTAADVLALAGRSRLNLAAPPSPAVAPAARAIADSPQDGAANLPSRLVPLTPSRRLIAQRMVESKRTAPHAWTTVEIDVTNVWAWRMHEKAAFEQNTGVKLTLLPFFMHAVVEALHRYPAMNASFTDDGIRLHAHMNIGIAVAVDENLLVPVIRNAETLSIRGLALAAGAIIEKARTKKLGPDDLAGGTFTVNNTGASGSILTAPILVSGQAGIVTMESVVKRPMVRGDDAIVIRSMMNSCLSLDHRAVDGAIAIGFLAAVKATLENMGPAGAL